MMGLISLFDRRGPSIRGAGGLLNRIRHLTMDLTSSQWELLSPLLNKKNLARRRGRPTLDTRGAINGVFWVLRHGARWADLPSRYPPHQTCHRRYLQWESDGTLSACFLLLAEDLGRKGGEEAHDLPPAARSRSWKWHTALLLRCPLAADALAAAGKDQPPAPSDDDRERGAAE
jgi:transposase